MEEFGSSWNTIRIVIACLIGGMAAAQMKKVNATEKEEKAMGWVFIIVAIASFIFIKAVIIITGLLTLLFLANALGPQIINWANEAKNGIGGEINAWNHPPQPNRLPNNRLLEEIEEALENGASNDEISEHIKKRKSICANRNGRK